MYVYILYNKYYSSLPVLRFVFGPLEAHFQLPGHDLIKSCTFIVLTCVVLLPAQLCWPCVSVVFINLIAGLLLLLLCFFFASWNRLLFPACFC